MANAGVFLNYNYPSLNLMIAENIWDALWATPPFYFELLSLMQRLNMPAPFTPNVYPRAPLLSLYSKTLKTTASFVLVNASTQTDDNDASAINHSYNLSDDESEMSADSDHTASIDESVPLCVKQSMCRCQWKRMYCERRRLRRVLKSTKECQQKKSERRCSKKIARCVESTETAFDCCSTYKRPEISIRISPESTFSGNIPNNDGHIGSTSNFGSFDPSSKQSVEQDDSSAFDIWAIEPLSLSQIDRCHISLKEMKAMPAFRDYDSGEPSTRLYVKNIAKKASELELQSIFVNFVDRSNLDDSNAFDVRLMSGGRMRGQAFVCLGSIDNARRAIACVNGYLLHGKPLVVAFARSIYSTES